MLFCFYGRGGGAKNVSELSGLSPEWVVKGLLKTC